MGGCGTPAERTDPASTSHRLGCLLFPPDSRLFDHWNHLGIAHLKAESRAQIDSHRYSDSIRYAYLSSVQNASHNGQGTTAMSDCSRFVHQAPVRSSIGFSRVSRSGRGSSKTAWERGATVSENISFSFYICIGKGDSRACPPTSSVFTQTRISRRNGLSDEARASIAAVILDVS